MIDSKNKIIFVHIPKTGGTSIAKMIWGKSLTLKEGKHYTIRDYYERYDTDGYYRFSFVRNPYARAQSYYKYLIQHKNPSRINCSFRDWVFNMHGEPMDLFLPQIHFVDDSVEIFKFENFTKSLNALNKKIKLMRSNVHNENKTTDAIKCNLTDGIKEKLYQIYKEDFKRFNYIK